MNENTDDEPYAGRWIAILDPEHDDGSCGCSKYKGVHREDCPKYGDTND